MKRFTCRFAAVAIISLLLSSQILGCDSKQPPSSSQTDSKQNPEQSQTIPKSTSNPLESLIAEALEEEGVSGLTVNEAQGFALWVRGKLSVSSGGADQQDDELLLEVDPSRFLTRIWTALEIDGPLVATGEVKASGLHAVGTISAAAVSARDASFENAEFEEVNASNAELEKLASSVAQIAKITSEQLSVSGDVSVSNLSVSEEITSSTARTQSLSAQTIEAGNLSASSASLDTVSALQGIFESVSSNSISANSLEASAVSATTISAAESVASATVSCTSLTASDIVADSIDATALKARSISGTLSSLTLPSDCCGSVTFPAVDASGEGLDATLTIEASPKASGIVITQTVSNSPYLYVCEVAQIGEGQWEISRRFECAMQNAIDDGSFAGIPETEVYWIAFTQG